MIDRSAIEAGDTVTVIVQQEARRPEFTITGNVYYYLGILNVGTFSLDSPAITITDHTPAPPGLPTTPGSTIRIGLLDVFLTDTGWIDTENDPRDPSQVNEWTLIRDAGAERRRYCKACGKELGPNATARAQYCVERKPDGSRDQRCKNLYHASLKGS